MPLTHAHTHLSELPDEATVGGEKIITSKGKSDLALIDSYGLDRDHQLERKRLHLLLIDDARQGLADIEGGRTRAADAAFAQVQQRRNDVAKAQAVP